MTIKTQTFYGYNVETAPVKLPLTLAETRLHLRLPVGSEEDYLTLLVDSARDFFERHTNRILINTSLKAFLDQFPATPYFFNGNCVCEENGLLIKRATVSSITTIKYYIDDVLTTWTNTNYSLQNVQTFPLVLLTEDSSYPTTDSKNQAVEIIFVAGYGANETDIPSDIRLALLNHVAFLYENRGDCGDDGGNLPCIVKKTYEKYRIRSLGWGGC